MVMVLPLSCCLRSFRPVRHVVHSALASKSLGGLQILVPLLYLALITAAGCFVAGLVMLSTLASDELRDVLSDTLAQVGECVSG